MPNVDPIPEDFHTITPYLVVRNAERAIHVYERAFGARELYRNLAPDGRSVIHSELLLGDSRLFINEEFPDFGQHSPHHYGGSAVTLHLYVSDVDALFKRAVEAGVEVTVPLDDQFWGDRYAKVRDPFGHEWSLASRIEDLAPETVHERARAVFNPDGGS
jgi:PhnB protein